MINDYIIGEHVQGTVVNKITLQGLFWLRIMRRVSEGALMVISQSIRYDTINHAVDMRIMTMMLRL